MKFIFTLMYEFLLISINYTNALENDHVDLRFHGTLPEKHLCV